MKRTVILISALCLGSAALFSGVGAGYIAKSFSVGEPPSGATPPQAKKGERRRFTRTVLYPKPGPRYDTVKQLAAESDGIVIGTPLFEVGHRRSPADKTVWTYYQVKIVEGVKGNFGKGKKLSLRVLGGRAVEADGSSVEVLMPEYWKDPEQGKGYVFFLKKGKAAAGKSAPYRLVGGPQGLFEITPWPVGTPAPGAAELLSGRAVVPQVREGDPLMKNYKGMSLTTFLQQVRQAVGAS